jgi:serine protease Do
MDLPQEKYHINKGDTMRSTGRKYLYFIIPVFLLAGIIIGFIISSQFETQTISFAEKSRVPLDTREELNRISAALSHLAAAVSPSVVNVSTTRKMQGQHPQFDLFNDPLLRRFFDGRRNFETSSLGSGVIISSDGHILTSNHLIEAADTIIITLQDKRTFEGKLIGADPKTDLALIQIDSADLPALVLNDRDDLRVGELVVAVGIPFGLSHTVTMGIVSAVGRSNIGIVDYEDFIQTDAAINPGNSGGALVNSGGELVGINTAIFSTSGGSMGVGFAIPAKMAKSVTESLLEHGKVIRGWLGVSIQHLTPELAEYFQLEDLNGALISEVMEDSPASRAGLQQGDIVIAFAGQDITAANELKNAVAATSPDSTVTMTIIREKTKKDIEVTLGDYPARSREPGISPTSEGLFGGVGR